MKIHSHKTLKIQVAKIVLQVTDPMNHEPQPMGLPIDNISIDRNSDLFNDSLLCVIPYALCIYLEYSCKVDVNNPTSQMVLSLTQPRDRWIKVHILSMHL